MTQRRALWILIVVSAVLRVVWASILGLGNDEAYHYLFTVHRDWSYFDHPPMLALVESLGLLFGGGSSAPVFLRLGFILMFAGSTWLMARLTTRFFGSRAGFWAAFALNLSAYHTAAVGAFALPDGPLLFFWLLTLDRLAAAFEKPESIGRWCLVGLAWGCALLSKYHAVFLPAGAAVYLVFQPTARRALLKPGPYVAAVLGVACFAPVIYWNASHDWASFAFQGGRAAARTGFRPDALVGAIAGQAAYLFPWIWFGLVSVLFASARRILKGEASDAERFLASQSVAPLSLFMTVACLRPILPHWTLVAYLSVFPLLGRWCEWAWENARERMSRRVAICVATTICVACVFAVQHHFGILQKGGQGSLAVLKPNIDPTAEMYGWDQIAEELRSRGLLGRDDVFLFTGNWYLSGQTAFAVRGTGTQVLCYHATDARSFGYWSKPESWIGKTGVMIALKERGTDVEPFSRYFTKTDLLAEFDVKRAGGPIRGVRLYLCENQRLAFPFGNGTKHLTARSDGKDARIR